MLPAASVANLPSPVIVTAGWDWSPVLDPTVGLLVMERRPATLDPSITAMLDRLSAPLLVSGPIMAIGQHLADLPPALAADIKTLAARFAQLMEIAEVRIRLEVVTTDACRNWHVDYTDLRLVVTYAGPGTQFRLDEEGEVEQLQPHQVALFKGRRFGEGHALLPHRSPQIAGTGVRRLLLVIDTPADSDAA